MTISREKLLKVIVGIHFMCTNL